MCVFSDRFIAMHHPNHQCGGTENMRIIKKESFHRSCILENKFMFLKSLYDIMLSDPFGDFPNLTFF